VPGLPAGKTCLRPQTTAHGSIEKGSISINERGSTHPVVRVVTVIAEPGERLVDRAEVGIVLLADDEALTVTRLRFGSTGPQPHVHRLHADCFLLFDGTMRMQLGAEEQFVEPISWVQVPNGVVHTFAPETGEVTFLNVHAPSCGFGAYLRGRNPDFDQHAPPSDGGRDPAHAVVRRLGGGGEGETITDRPGRKLTLLADTEELAATESMYGPGERGPDLHVHREHTDAWLVLEGALTFALRDDLSFEAGPGTVVVVPPNVAHGFANEGEKTVRYLNFHAPSCGFGAYLRGENPGFDQHEPPPDGGLDPSAVVVRTLS
jgi:mannose-6-phosphate isomerase-like protein (cupin superfamily)